MKSGNKKSWDCIGHANNTCMMQRIIYAYHYVEYIKNSWTKNNGIKQLI